MSEPSSLPAEKPLITLASQEMMNGLTVQTNLRQNLLMITEDKVRLILREHDDNRQDRNAWLVPVGVALPVLLTLASASFHPFLVAADVWEAMFVIVAAASVIYFGVCIIRRPHASTIDEVVKRLYAAQAKPPAPDD